MQGQSDVRRIKGVDTEIRTISRQPLYDGHLLPANTPPPNSATCSASHGPPCTGQSGATQPGNAPNDKPRHQYA